MSDDKNKNLLYLLNKDGGWADDVPEDSEKRVQLDAPQKAKAWDTVAKPDVVPIGTDFDINGSQEKRESRYSREPSSRDDGHRDGGYRGGQRDREEGGYRGGQREGGYRGGQREGGYRGGQRDREEGGYRGPRDREEGGYRGGQRDGQREGGFRRDNRSGGRFGGRRFDEEDDNRSWRSDKPMQAPSTRSEPRGEQPKENPFGSATPIVTTQVETSTPVTPSSGESNKVKSDIFGGATPVVPKAKETTPTIRRSEDSQRRSDNLFGGRKDKRSNNNGGFKSGNKFGNNNKGGFQKQRQSNVRRNPDQGKPAPVKPVKVENQKGDKTITNSFALLEEA